MVAVAAVGAVAAGHGVGGWSASGARSTVEVVLEDLGHAIGQGAHAVGAKAQRAPAADAGQLAHDLAAGVRSGSIGRGQAQDVGDQPADGFGDGGGIGAGLGGVDEDFEGLAAAVLVDGDEGFAQRGVDGVGVAGQGARARFLGLVPDEHWLFGWRLARQPAASAAAVSFLASAVAWVSSTTLSREPVT